LHKNTFQQTAADSPSKTNVKQQKYQQQQTATNSSEKDPNYKKPQTESGSP